MSTRNEKKARITGKGAYPAKPKKAPMWILPAALLAVFAVLAASQVIKQVNDSPVAKVEGTNVGAVSYSSQEVIQQTPITVTQADGFIRVPLAEIKSKRLVGFTWKGQDKELALLAYIAPSGKLVTAVSICEPCNGYTFRIENNSMVCNACGTRWGLENLNGLSGGCLAYPPDAFPNQVEGDTVLIPETNVANWERRI